MNEAKGKLFFELIKTLRQKQGLTMAQLCEGVCTQRMISYIEKGERFPDKLI